MGDLKRWPIFNFIQPEFLQKIQLALVYDDNVFNCLIVTHDYKLYTFSSCRNNGFAPKLISNDELHIKSIAYMRGPYILILTYIGKVYLIDKKYYNAKSFIINGCQLEYINNQFHNEKVKDIACGGSICLVLTFSGKVYESNLCNHFVLINERMNILNKRIVSISCGNNNNAIVTDDGIIHTWNYHQQTSNTFEKPVPIKKVACGYDHFLALDDEGFVYAWGSNTYGQLGNGTYEYGNQPIIVPGIHNILDIATTSKHNISIAMGEGNCIFVWGSCLEQKINVATLTNLSSIHDAFACYAIPRVMHQPLVKNSNLKLIDSLRNAFNVEATSDFTVKVHGKSIHVNKSILILRSQHFRKKLAKDSADESQCITEHEIFSYDVYKAFFQYLYTDEINLPAQDTTELLQLASYYSMNQLKRCCTKTICKNITVENVLSIYNLAIRYQAKELENYCFKFALKNMTAVIKTPGFIEFDVSLIKLFLLKAVEAHVFRT